MAPTWTESDSSTGITKSLLTSQRTASWQVSSRTSAYLNPQILLVCHALPSLDVSVTLELAGLAHGLIL